MDQTWKLIFILYTALMLHQIQRLYDFNCLKNVIIINAEQTFDLNGNSEKRDFIVKRIEFEHINFET